jgi:hypothetical protein
MEQVLGKGGVFFKARGPKALAATPKSRTRPVIASGSAVQLGQVLSQRDRF